MRVTITPGRGRITVGPPGGPSETIPAAVTVTITDTVAYDVEARLEWSPTVGKLAVRRDCCSALPGGDDVSPAGLARIALRDTVRPPSRPSTSAAPAGPDSSPSSAPRRSPSTR